MLAESEEVGGECGPSWGKRAGGGAANDEPGQMEQEVSNGELWMSQEGI